MHLSDFDFDLPVESIALRPNSSRSGSRLLMLDKKTGALTHGIFTDIKGRLRPGDLLLLNDTRVIPARLKGKKPTGGAVELLLTERVATAQTVEGEQWKSMARPAKGLDAGARVLFDNGVIATVTAVNSDAEREVLFTGLPNGVSAPEALGEIPLPPYIKRAPEPEDALQYQTVYAKHDGAVAAPTAGLHFTPELIEEIEAAGVTVKSITLHVGPGTFLPVRVESIEEHRMLSERYSIGADVVEAILKTKAGDGRVVAVGTTTTRAIEGAWRSLKVGVDGKDGVWQALKEPSGSGTVFEEGGAPCALEGTTDIFIYPGFRFSVLDALLTNFHLPRSTLIMLVSALAGREKVLAAYEEAVREGYRFYSYGDAMFIE